jgi:tetratricopeptide (TPR) repeat protein
VQHSGRPGLCQAFLSFSGFNVRDPLQEDIASTIGAARKALASGDVATTERLCKALVEAAPQDARAWALLAETALLRNRLDAAKVCADRAVALAPHEPIAHIMQAKTLLYSGEIAAALKAAEAASPFVGAAPEAADSLAAIFGLLGHHRRALELSRRAVSERPDNAQFMFNLAATERMLGMLGEAEAHCDKAIAHEPTYGLAHYLRADLRIQSVDRNQIAEMESIVEGRALDWRSEVMLRYALAKECEDIEAHDRAFAHVDAGAKLWRQHADYDARAEIAEIDRIITTQNSAWLASIARSRVVDAPVFVCGLPRTGTTLAERIITSHSAVDSVGETGVFAIEAARALRARRASGAPDFNTIGEQYICTVSNVFAPQKSRFVDKTLQNYLYCGLIHAALPQAKIILVERCPMDAAWALYKAHFQAGYLFSYDLAELADYYLAFRRIVEHWKKTLPSHAVLTVSYEDVVWSPREQSVRILEFLGLPWEESTLRFHESRAPSATASAVQVRRPIYATSIDKWRLHAGALAPFRDRLLKSLPSFELS